MFVSQLINFLKHARVVYGKNHHNDLQLCNKLCMYSDIEEKINSYTHFFGAFISLSFMIYLVSFDITNIIKLLFLLFFSFTSICTFIISGLYHKETNINKKIILRKLDHISIFLNIIGTFVTIAFFTLPLNINYYLFIICELLLAIYGIYFKCKSNKCYNKCSVLLYIAMIIPLIFIAKPIIYYLSLKSLICFILSLLACLLGIPFYLLKSIKLTHCIWHIFVIISSIFSNVLIVCLLKNI